MKDQRQRALEAADVGSLKKLPEDVGCVAHVNNTFLNFYVRMDHPKRDDKDTMEKLFRSQSEGSFGSLRSDSTMDVQSTQEQRMPKDGDSASENASAETGLGEVSPSDTVTTVVTSTLTSYLNDSGTEPLIPTKGKGKGPRQGPIQQKDFCATQKQKGFTKVTSKNSIKGTSSTGTCRQNQAGNNQCNLNQDEIGKPCVDELSKLVNKDKNATPLNQLHLPTFDDFSTDNLANTMWHCMKLCEKTENQEFVERILVPVLKAAEAKVGQFRYKYLAMALFSVAGYREKTISERGRNAVDAFAPIFAQAYTEWLESTKDLKSKDARQGVANALNAVGRLSNMGNHAENLCIAVSRALLQEDGTCGTKTVIEVMQFQAKELSMAVHGMSKVFKQKKTQEQEKPDEVKRFAAAAFKQAREKIKDQSDQGLSNIAMAVVNLRMQTCHEGKEFLRAAAVAATEKMKDRKEYFAGQAVANLCSAVKDLEPCEEKVWFLEVAVGYVEAHEERLSWQDLAEVMVSLALHVQNCETLGLTCSETLWYFAETILKKAENARTKKKEKQHVQSISDAAKKILRSRVFGKIGPMCWAICFQPWDKIQKKGNLASQRYRKW